MPLCLGKLDPVRPSRVPLLREITTCKVPAAPASIAAPNPPQGGWQMLGNDEKGDCTIAGAGHEEMVFQALSGEPTTIPTASQAIAVYESLTGGPDTGLAIADVLRAQRNTGLFSAADKLAGYALLAEGSLRQIHEAIAYFGCAKLGIQCPESAQVAAQRQAETGEMVTWTYDPSSPIVGGHDIEAVGYDDDRLYIVSWGALCRISLSFFAHYCDEAWAPLAIQFREAGHAPLGIDWASLDAELDAL